MKRLGFFIDKDGKITYYGQWAEQIDNNNRQQFHDSSFFDDIENTLYFKNLHLMFDPNQGLFNKGINFSLQGMILLLNLTVNSDRSMIMFVPTILSKEQKITLNELYSTLTYFDDIKIVMPKSEIINDEDVYESLDDYYNYFNVQQMQNIKR